MVLPNVAMPSRALLVLGALAAPIALLSVYLYLSRWPNRWFSPATDFIALGISILVGGLCVWRLLPSRRSQLVAVSIYVVAYFVVLFVYGFSFVCNVFQDCL